MNLRQLTCVAVFLACTLAVTAAPVVDLDDMDLEARDWDADLTLRDYGGERLADMYYATYLERRAPQKKTSAKKPSPSTPKKTAPKKATRPGKATPKKATPKKATPKKATPKKPSPQKKPANNARPRPNQPGQKPPSKKPNSAPQGPQKPPQAPTGGSCAFTPKGRKGKRAPFDAQASCAELTLGSTTRGIQKVTNQGNSAITYKVTGGWPDSSNRDVVAYAKTGPASRPRVSFDDEIKWLGRTEQLLAQGTSDTRNWIVFRGVEGKVEIADTTHYKTQLVPDLVGGTTGPCRTWVTGKIDLVVAEVRYYVERYGVRHMDVHPGNILWDENAARPYLIDWGFASEVPQEWTAEIEASVRSQATRSHLEGDNNICASFV